MDEGEIMIRQILAITVPDDMEYPADLVQRALEHYLEHGDRWREVKIEAAWVSEVSDPPRTMST
jgi:hypothetical protein